MLFRIRRSQAVIFAVLGCLALLILIRFGGVRVLAQPTPTPSELPGTVTEAPDLGQHFKELGLEGSILIYDSNNNRTYEHNPQRNARAITPASTFKIFNAMVALETGVIADDGAVLTWDGIHRDIAAWNHDTNLRPAFKDSTVWFYQVLARKAGHEQMQQFVDQVGYGNRQIGTVQDIDRFWLEGPLQITPTIASRRFALLKTNNGSCQRHHGTRTNSELHPAGKDWMVIQH